MTAYIDHTGGRMHIEGASHEPNTDTLRWIAAETRARELVEALKAALAGAPHWRFEAQRLLERIASGELREPRP